MELLILHPWGAGPELLSSIPREAEWGSSSSIPGEPWQEGDSPAACPRGCCTPKLRPAWHRAVCALVRKQVPQGVLLVLPRASPLQAACSLLLPPFLPPPGTLCSCWPCWENQDSPAMGTGVCELQPVPVPGSCPQRAMPQGSGFCKHPTPAVLFWLQTETLQEVSLQTAAVWLKQRRNLALP